ncbi:hypothetical protein SBA2_80056 [Acidobacteriia bacterium SbA2]|nr:hypothetical protein SBA2_80056 [Acidobacteriia bacterium SbA2]
MGANAIIGTCYDNALDVETLFHGAAVIIEPIQPKACGLGGPEGPISRDYVTVHQRRRMPKLKLKV